MLKKRTKESLLIVALVFLCLIPSFLHAQKKKATHVVITSPAVNGAAVYLDGKLMGQTGKNGQFFLIDVEVGQHTIAVRKGGYRESSWSGELSGISRSFTLRMQKMAPPPPTPLITPSPTPPPKPQPKQVSKIFVNCNEESANVFLDGNFIGKTNFNGDYLINTAPGSHTVEVEKKGFSSVRNELDVKAGLTKGITVSLSPRASDSSLLIVLALVLVVLVGAVTYLVLRPPGEKGKLRFDRYIIQKVIGRGGMATIYKAKDTTASGIVALKIMDMAFQNDADLIRKFMREGWALSEINKDIPEAPIVKIFRYGRENNRTKGKPFIAMEYLQGKDLLSLIRSKHFFSINYAYKVITQIAQALAAAHKKGIYHRDVTPDNVIVIRNDPENPVVKLIDFGVARHEYTAVGTLDGSIAGKPPYMSPEQCRGERVDGRSDIYSLGVLFYTLLDGNPPFVGKNPFEVMRAHETTPVPPLNRNVPQGVKTLLFRMLKKNKDERYKSMNEFLMVLEKMVVSM